MSWCCPICGSLIVIHHYNSKVTIWILWNFKLVLKAKSFFYSKFENRSWIQKKVGQNSKINSQTTQSFSKFCIKRSGVQIQGFFCHSDFMWNDYNSSNLSVSKSVTSECQKNPEISTLCILTLNYVKISPHR